MTPRTVIAALAAISLAMLSACEQKAPEPVVPKKVAAEDAAKKAVALRKLGVSFDEKIAPPLNPEQQQKLQTLREQMRRRLIAEMAEKALQKAKADVSAWFVDAPKAQDKH